jgi:hypothetical protein
LSIPSRLSTFSILLVHLVVRLPGQAAGHPGELVVQAGRLARGARDDERRAGLVDQDRVNLVDDGKGVAPLDHVLQAPGHVVTQVVEAELGVGPVGDVAVVGVLLVLPLGHVRGHPAHREPEGPVDLAHPVRVARSQVVVDRHHVHALGFQGVEIDGKGGDERLAFARLHLGDPAEVQGGPAHQLHVVVALADGALGRLAHDGKGLRELVVEVLAVGQALSELYRLVGEILVRKGF